MSSQQNKTAIGAPAHAVDRISVQSFYDLDQSIRDQSIILDLGQAQTYSRGHIPGAVHLPVSRIVRQAGYAPGLLPSETSLKQLAQDYGLGEGKTIYIYDDEGGGWAGRMVWILDILNIQNVVYIDGGLRAWVNAGLGLDGKRHDPVAGRGVETINPWSDVTLVEMRELVQTQSVMFLDARSRLEYTGERQFAQKSGRIPGAVHYEWTQGMALDQDSCIRSLDLIRDELAALGIDGEKTITTYCQTHHRSGFTYLLCRLLGYSVRAYAGSWSEWGNQFDVPIEKG